MHHIILVNSLYSGVQLGFFKKAKSYRGILNIYALLFEANIKYRVNVNKINLINYGGET